MCAPVYGRKPGRYALSNLYMTNSNPDLPPVLCSGITIPRPKGASKRLPLLLGVYNSPN